MKAIIVDDEPIMIKSFMRLGEGIEGLDIVGSFEFPVEALIYARNNPVDIAFLDVAMPQMLGIELGQRLREINPEMLIVFVSAYDEYIRESNDIGADYYIVKPYTRKTLEMMMERMRLLVNRQKKSIYIQTFGKFNVFKDGKPVPLRGKAKEILALIVTRRGKEIGNEEIYSIIWEDREYSNVQMKVYYNALKRLKDALKENGLENLVISTTRGQMINREIIDCDYYDLLEKKSEGKKSFDGEFLSDYSWGEYILGDIMRSIYYDN